MAIVVTRVQVFQPCWGPGTGSVTLMLTGTPVFHIKMPQSSYFYDNSNVPVFTLRKIGTSALFFINMVPGQLSLHEDGVIRIFQHYYI